MKPQQQLRALNDKHQEPAELLHLPRSTFLSRLSVLSRAALRLSLFLVGGLILFGPVFDALVPHYFVYRKGDQFVFDQVALSKQPFPEETLLIGDSVGRQLLHGFPKHRTIFLWQSAALVGQYIVAKNAFETGSPIRKVYLIFVPHSFGNNLDQPYTYLDFVRTLYSRENRDSFTEAAEASIQRALVGRFALHSLVKMTDLAFFDYDRFNPHRDSFEPYTSRPPLLSKISIEYLRKLDKLCREHRAKLILLPSPFMDGPGNDLTAFRAQVKQAKLGKLFKRYFKKVSVYPESAFRDDKIHFNDEFLGRHLTEIQKHLGFG